MKSLRFILPSYTQILGLGPLGSNSQVLTTEWIMPDVLSTLSADNILHCSKNGRSEYLGTVLFDLDSMCFA